MKNNYLIENSIGSISEVRDGREYYFLLFESNTKVLYKIIDLKTGNLKYYNTNLNGKVQKKSVKKQNDQMVTDIDDQLVEMTDDQVEELIKSQNSFVEDYCLNEEDEEDD